MEAIILAGGFGTRLKSIVSDVPKPMAPIKGRPFLEILLNRIAQKGYSRVILSVGYMAASIIDHFGSSFSGLEIDYVIESTPLGTGGAIRAALDRCNADHVTVLNGDTFLEFDPLILEALWRDTHAPIILTRLVDDTTRFGCIEVCDGVIRRFAEKSGGGPGLINAGCYVFPIDLLRNFDLPAPFSIESDFLAHDIARRAYLSSTVSGKFIDIGIPEEFARAQDLLV